jgi:uncharacterized protein
MKLVLLDGSYSVCRFDAGSKIPQDVFSGSGFASVTRTADEISIVRETGSCPSVAREERGWKVLMVEGPLDFGMIGVLSSISSPLAQAGISIFVISTFDTDYVLVKEGWLDDAFAVLSAAGFTLDRAPAAP